MRKTPQEKKAESYARDRRNTYGENAKASRKGIARRKRERVRVERRLSRHLADAYAPNASEGQERAEGRLLRKRREAGSWKKKRDEPLGVIVRAKLVRREAGVTHRSWRMFLRVARAG